MSSDAVDEELAKRIRTLTSVLHRFNVQKSPSKQPRDILPFLRHFTTLLSCGDKEDRQAKKVIAVTGSIDASNQFRTLVVSQNPHLRSPVEIISLDIVKKDKRPLTEVIKGPPNPPLFDHIADVWAALYDFHQAVREPDYEDQLEALQLFFLSRSYRKFVVRFREDVVLCGKKRLYQVITEWQPDRSEITPKWVTPFAWLLQSRGLPSIKSRTVQGQIQWEFSDDTKQAWSKILATLLFKVDGAIEQVKTARSRKNAEEEARQAMSNLNMWCRLLWYFVTWDAGIVKSLLTETNMVEGITTTFMHWGGSSSAVEEADDDDAVELRQEPDESKGQQVFRYLKTVIAWHQAVYRFSRDVTLPSLLDNLEIGLVEVPSSSSSVLTLPQTSQALFERFPDMVDVREEVLNELAARHSDTFSGCIHAEATLMGLVNYYVHETTHAKRCAAVMNTQHMRNIIEPVANSGSAVIAVSKKCCWCCDWLGKNLETQFKLPGTHGIMYPWDPPTVGIGASVLKELEEALWKELEGAVFSAVSLAYSRHSSAATSPPGSPSRIGVTVKAELDMGGLP